MAVPVDMCIKNRIESGKLTDSILQFLRGNWREGDVTDDIEWPLVRLSLFPSLTHVVLSTCLLTCPQSRMSR